MDFTVFGSRFAGTTEKIHELPSTSHSAYVATETELVRAKIDGLLPPNFL